MYVSSLAEEQLDDYMVPTQTGPVKGRVAVELVLFVHIGSKGDQQPGRIIAGGGQAMIMK